MRRADIGVPIREVDENSHPRQACYPWSNFSDIFSPHRWGLEGSLGPAFASASLSVKETVRPAFGLTLYSGFLTRLSWSLGPLDIFSRGGRPSQTAHLLMSLSKRQVREIIKNSRCYIGASTYPKEYASKAPDYAVYNRLRPNNKLQ